MAEGEEKRRYAMKLYPFSALLSRMRYINRWGLMRAARQENLAGRRHAPRNRRSERFER